MNKMLLIICNAFSQLTRLGWLASEYLYQLLKLLWKYLLISAPPPRLVKQVTFWLETCPSVCFIPPHSAIFGKACNVVIVYISNEYEYMIS